MSDNNRKLIDKEIVMVMYPHGACGIFISSLLYAMLNRRFIDLQFTSEGESMWYKTLTKTSLDEQDLKNVIRGIPSTELQAFANNLLWFNNQNFNPDIVVIPSHSFFNIPLYQKIFPKLTIVNIEIEDVVDDIARLLHGFLKFTMTNDHPSAKSELLLAEKILLRYVKNENKEEGLESLRSRQDFNDLMAWSLYKMRWGWRNERHWNTNIYQLPDSISFRIPFKHIRYNNIQSILECIRPLFINGIDLEQEDFFRRNVQKYYDLQNQLVMLDPQEYLKQQEIKARAFLKNYV